MMRGSCCCGAVAIELNEPPSMMATCHCSRCRKLGIGTFVFVARKSMSIVGGRDDIARYAPEAPYKYHRCFCRLCGTALGEILSEEDTFPIAANLLDEDPGVRNRFHEFVGEKPGWYEICDGAKQFEAHPVRT